jgi:hypothetical protein
MNADSKKKFYFPKTAESKPKHGDRRLDLIFAHSGAKLAPRMQSYVYTEGIAAKGHSEFIWEPDVITEIHPEILFDVLEELITVEHKNGSRR